jgi:hypothetical protein
MIPILDGEYDLTPVSARCAAACGETERAFAMFSHRFSLFVWTFYCVALATYSASRLENVKDSKNVDQYIF